MSSSIKFICIRKLPVLLCRSQSVQPLDSTSSGFLTATRSAEGEALEY